MLVAIVEDDKVLYKKEEKILNDMATLIVPYIEECFNNVPFEIQDIDNIYIVNGPGSFTGVRIGVTTAKVIAWALNKPLIPLSSLEVLASTSTTNKYRISAIDARRGHVFAGVYNNELNSVVEDSYTTITELQTYIDEGDVIGYDNPEWVNPELDIVSIIKKHEDDLPINPHELKPNYLKLTEAEEKRKDGE
jgi:tRNA threonylcarbamoyl adenosine modification protein YeaZ